MLKTLATSTNIALVSFSTEFLLILHKAGRLQGRAVSGWKSELLVTQNFPLLLEDPVKEAFLEELANISKKAASVSGFSVGITQMF